MKKWKTQKSDFSRFRTEPRTARLFLLPHSYGSVRFGSCHSKRSCSVYTPHARTASPNSYAYGSVGSAGTEQIRTELLQNQPTPWTDHDLQLLVLLVHSINIQYLVVVRRRSSISGDHVVNRTYGVRYIQYNYVYIFLFLLLVKNNFPKNIWSYLLRVDLFDTFVTCRCGEGLCRICIRIIP